MVRFKSTAIKGGAVALFALAVVAAAAPAAPAEKFNEQAEGFVREVFNAAKATAAQSGTREEIAQRLAAFVQKRVEINALSRFAVGGYWNRTSAKEQARFKTLFGTHLALMFGRYVGQIVGQKLKIERVIPAAGDPRDVIVLTKLVHGTDNSVHFDWRVRPTDNGIKIVDVIIQGTSMAVAQRHEFMSIIRANNGSVQALNDKLEARVQKLKNGAGDTSVAQRPNLAPTSSD